MDVTALLPLLACLRRLFSSLLGLSSEVKEQEETLLWSLSPLIRSALYDYFSLRSCLSGGQKGSVF